MKKAISALGLLLISAILLAVSSYAWFSLNGSVTATGMEVTVSVPSSLSISVTNESEGFIASVALENDSSMDEPIMPTVYGKNPNGFNERDFFVLTEDAMATVNENGILGEIPDSSGSIEDISENEYYTLTETDYFKDVMWLRYDGTEHETLALNVKIEWENAEDVNDDIKNAFHILLIGENGNVLVDYDMSNAATPMSLEGFILTSGAETGTKITAYGFISGSDEDCKNSAISSNTTLKVKITFFGAEG
ncbi:MAG: hypothetical protein ACOX3X_05190 [Eubacteriales bacterium]|jgi:hypothetical protein